MYLFYSSEVWLFLALLNDFTILEKLGRRKISSFYWLILTLFWQIDSWLMVALGLLIIWLSLASLVSFELLLALEKKLF
jgi:hypothetical protein